MARDLPLAVGLAEVDPEVEDRGVGGDDLADGPLSPGEDGPAGWDVQADCGACSVTLDGRLVCSCLVLAAETEGKKVETIEGMANGEELHPLQQKFLDHAALQCGYCTPGFLVAAKALLEKNPDPTETEVRFWLAGNLCRCTGYDEIVRAVMDAAAEMRGN